MLLYRTTKNFLLKSDDKFFTVHGTDFDELLNLPNLHDHLLDISRRGPATQPPAREDILAPIGTQEVWAAGVTYERSREGRQEESKESGAAIFYSKVYEAERPELFFKAPGWRAIGPDAKIRVRKDARWSVPEPELVLAINADGQIIGYTLGNDVSSRDIEGENPLYLPQAKVYDGSCAVGPAICITNQPLDLNVEITLTVERSGQPIFKGSVPLSRIRRPFSELVEYLFRELDFPVGAFLFTGTGIVPPNDFTLLSGDLVRIAAEPIGELANAVS
ncbi:MAG TPA: fumarylacetoacetate hydrolase family protein [Chthoniobacterales bacterium]|nr:fumarylacetoacetate hydrolase family protein [Chthoniobacterales bacterium]